MDFQTRYQKLNQKQQQAVDTIDGPVMVIAGPGTGKTELLSMRAANILRLTDTLPENILCLTFTESGAAAMRARLASIIGMDAYKVAIHTFHSFGTEIINQNGAAFFSGATFQPADDLSRYEILHAIFDEQDYTNPITAKMNGEYTHLNDTITAISELKRSGLTSSELLLILAANDAVFDAVEPEFQAIFADRVGKTTAPKLAKIVAKLQHAEVAIPIPGITPIARIIADSLAEMLEKVETEGSTKPLTAWKNAWFKKNDKGDFVFKARERQTKLRAVSYVYGRYIDRMQEEQLYDFDDMILQVVHAMEVNDELKFNLQERYQYIMVDEFQDTNLAQMRILTNLVDNPVNEGRPNLLVVGDDDQAIYSFQGADVGNINAFLQSFDQTTRITLVDNYRSAATILNHARSVITLGQNRLENYIEGLDKTLTPHHNPQKSSVELDEFATLGEERHWLAGHIAALIKTGVPAQSIAVIARRHYELQALLPYFAKYGVAVNYERRDNVLDNEVVQLIELIAHIAVALFEKRHNDADSMLPELLAHPAFGFNPQTIWQLSLTAHSDHKKWLEVMATTPEFGPLFTWLVTLSQLLAYQPLEHMLDLIIGLPPERREPDSPFDDDGIDHPTTDATNIMSSPLFDYFFAPDKLQSSPDRYINYLEALRTIRAKLRDYEPNEPPTLQSFLEFIRLHRELGSTITSLRAESQHQDYAINVMTAHKSKGLEYDHVFVIGAVDSSWGEHVRSKSRLIGYPENLPLAPSGDMLDERLRLFFVAMTRAKITLTISYSLCDDSGKTTLPASFLISDAWHPTKHTESSPQQQLESAQTAWYQPLTTPIEQSMKHLLAPRLENYKLSITHVNNFLDITHGGPQNFLLNNLLGFPQAMSPSAGFGSAIHASLQQAHVHMSATGELRPLEDTLHDFEEHLRHARLTDDDFTVYLQKGSDALTAFMNDKQSTFAPHQKAELNFAGQGIQIGDMRLTGMLDLVDINDGEIIVTDYKTGKPAQGWTGRTDYEKIKLHKYRQQLMFYNLLVRHSRDYSRLNFKKGILQFVEPTDRGEVLALEATFTNDELARFTELLTRVWQHIIALDFPTTDHYDNSYKGILAFEEDLLK